MSLSRTARRISLPALLAVILAVALLAISPGRATPAGASAGAAAHGGQLPAKLGDITAVPVPADPATGKSFLYQVQGDRVTLRDPPGANGRPALVTPLHYELTFKR